MSKFIVDEASKNDRSGKQKSVRGKHTRRLSDIKSVVSDPKQNNMTASTKFKGTPDHDLKTVLANYGMIKKVELTHSATAN